MSRVAQILKSKITLSILTVAVVAAAIGIGVAVYNKDNGNLQLVSSSNHQLSQISYDGQNGVNAYALLLRHATVKSKKYSFGYFVTSINGVAGNGPKYWTFYVNNKEASVGASSYTTKNSDRISWKLQ